MQNLHIQSVTSPAELAACADVLVQAYNSPPWNDAWTHEKALEKLLCFYQSPRFMGWKAVSENQVVAACVGNVEPYFSGDYFYLKEMFVLPALQGSGIGGMLLNRVKLYMEESGIPMLMLFTSNEGFPFGFYEKHGMSEVPGMRMMNWESPSLAVSEQ